MSISSKAESRGTASAMTQASCHPKINHVSDLISDDRGRGPPSDQKI